ncbi:MAG TPA: BON domain-containing protein [Burkholderiales bacterium]|nr:BON domain-containing protein [Burkholderiales bacterium]
MKATLTLLAFAGLAAGIRHYLGWKSAKGQARRAARPLTDNEIRESVMEGVPASIDVRVRNGIVALRGRASAQERDRALTHALAIPGVQRVYSDFETDTPTVQSQAGKYGIVHPR